MMIQPAPPLPASIPVPRLLAILAAEAAGYARLMTANDRLTVELLDAARAVFRTACAEQQGRVVDMAGDSVLLAFDSAASALRCALAVQQRLVAQASVDTGTLRLPFRIGLHLGDVIEKADGSVYGDGVNIAARLQALAEPDEVFASQAIRDLLGARPIARFEDAGEHRLKNVAEPLRLWRALPAGGEPSAAEPAAPGSGNLRFAERFELQPLERRVLVDGEPAALGARAFDLLLALSAKPGVLLTKNDLIDAVWPGVVVEEGNLATQISSLRKVLGGDVIVTIPGRGYRFAARLEAAAAAASPAAAEPRHTATPLGAQAPSESKLKTNLPSELPALLGRADNLAALGELVDHHRLVSVVGAGGMGKSLLTQHLLNDRQSAYIHGVCWVEMATVTDPTQLPGAIAAALGIQQGGSDAMAGLCSAVAPLQILVALDNAEQVLDGVARMAAALLAAAPGLRLVVTSQVPLKLAAERVYRIGPLAVPQGPLPAAEAREFGAVALFVDRAQAADSRFALTDANAPAVIELCRELDGLALAIELAAARAPMLGVQRLVASMQDRLKLLTTSRNRMAPARQQTLRATMEWSHGFLDQRERTVFRRLAVFAGSGSLTMIQQVVADPPGDVAGSDDFDEWGVLDALALLVDRSLVTVLQGNDTDEPRYRLLDSPRAYALERLKEAGEEGALRRRHVQAVAQCCEKAWHSLYSGEAGREDWHRLVALDAENARDAMSHALATGQHLATVQIGVIRLRNSTDLPTAQMVELAEQCTAHLDGTVPLVHQVRAWIQISRVLGDTRTRQAMEAAQSALNLLQDSPALQGDRFLSYLTWCTVAAQAPRGSGDDPEIQHALAQARALEDQRWPPHRRFWRADAEFFAARPGSRDVLRPAREALALDLASGGSGSMARCNLIDAELMAGEAQMATRTGEALLIDLQGGRDAFTLACARQSLTAAWLALDNADRARSLGKAGWPQGRLFELQPNWAACLALLAALEARPRAAARLAGYADAGYTALDWVGRPPNEAAAHARACTLARATLGDVEFDRLHAEGRLLSDEQIEIIAFATEDNA